MIFINTILLCRSSNRSTNPTLFWNIDINSWNRKQHASCVALHCTKHIRVVFCCSWYCLDYSTFGNIYINIVWLWYNQLSWKLVSCNLRLLDDLLVFFWNVYSREESVSVLGSFHSEVLDLLIRPSNTNLLDIHKSHVFYLCIMITPTHTKTNMKNINSLPLLLYSH